MFFGPFGLLELLLIFVLLVFVFGSKRLGQAARGLVQGFTSMQDAVQEETTKTKEKNAGKP
ncbi:MAG: twin-arginine translocase TatA/TatE family subunit [Dethiobacter sp.]|jgi:Sec-independent protein translocase protein TatA|nr:twin-arginine translocase TatA/TatE family subunit [Dethiobacter sp.]MBS3902059.1 twin-arginine translocase TatA/TatE family subunit [Dethiobacter sp.]MBS3990338.1 twin-arginine translocase TatA/TatE family subunit [Dethiobacter sp.]